MNKLASPRLSPTDVELERLAPMFVKPAFGMLAELQKELLR